MTRSPDRSILVFPLTAKILGFLNLERCQFSKAYQRPTWGDGAMTIQRDDVVFLGEVSCPDPYDSRRVPVYRVVRNDHPMFGQVITEQQVLQGGLFHSGLAAGIFRRVTRTGTS